MLRKRTAKIVLLVSLLCSMASCARFDGSSSVKKPTKVVDFPSMTGKSLQELTTMLGQAKQSCPTCAFTWDLAEGELKVQYESRDFSYRMMSSIDYTLKPDLAVSSAAEMMALINIDVDGKEAKKDRRGFFTYNDISVNASSGFVDIQPQKSGFIFAPRNPQFVAAEFYIQNPTIHLYKTNNQSDVGRTFYAQQTDIEISVVSATLGTGNWEVCAGPNFTGKCKILDGISSEYLDNRNNFSAFGIGNTIRSLRPVKLR